MVKIPTEHIRKNPEGIINQKNYFFAVKENSVDLIDKYAKSFIDSVGITEKVTLNLTFYKYKAHLNEKSVYKEGDETIYQNGEYLISSFSWHKGKFLGKKVFEDGSLEKIVPSLPGMPCPRKEKYPY